MSLAHPIWLILLVLLPIGVVVALVTAHRRRLVWGELVARRLRPALIRHGSPLPRWLALAMLLAAAGLLIVGIARPQGEAGTEKETTVARNLLIALDLSRSMRVPDVSPDRLSNAKLVIYELLDALPDERIGLIGFGGSGYLYAPLTIDHRAVRETVEQMDENWPTVGGSNLAEAVELGIDTLQETGQENNALIILSDGERHGRDLDEAIKEARESGVYILTIGVGTEDGSYVPNKDFPDNRMLGRDGKPVISRLQADVLRKLAEETGGAYAVAGSGADIPAMVQSAVAGLDAFEMEGRERKVMVEFYQWTTLPAIVLLIAAIITATRWRGVRMAAWIAAALLVAPGQADAQGDEGIRPLHRRLLDALPSASAHSRKSLAAAIEAYRAGEFATALDAYSRALRSADPRLLDAAHHGLGNSLFQIGWQQLARHPYPEEADTLPDLEAFDEMVRDRLAEIRSAQADDSAAGYRDIRTVITNWTDAVRHYDSSLDHDPGDAAVDHNRTLTMRYLERLAKLLEEHEEQTEELIPPPMPAEPQPEKSEDDDKGDEPKPNDESGENEDSPDQGDPKADNEDAEGPKAGDEERDDSGDADDPESERDRPANQPDDESPEERARRILKENADLEKGPLTPGQREFRSPEKDW